ncbi:MAG TPA: lytic transglycosylase domain-containing protein [Vicinamibacterales bacterium]|nr:lytic transglycosylase domain-containing protein [Vicinamibacterales bacterium]
MRFLPAALLLWLGTVVPASAQIYTWRDPSGHLVLSNKPTAGEAPMTTYAVPGSTDLRTATKPAAARAAVYDESIRRHATVHGVSVDLVRAVIQAESGFNPFAVSPKGAMGLMQLMPATARDLGVNNPFQPDENIRGGVTYLAGLLARFDQDVERALAAYNAGPERVDQYDGVPPFRETRAYVKRITTATRAAAPPETVIYKWMELVDGQPKMRYSNTPPPGQIYEVVRKR